MQRGRENIPGQDTHHSAHYNGSTLSSSRRTHILQSRLAFLPCSSRRNPLSCENLVEVINNVILSTTNSLKCVYFMFSRKFSSFYFKCFAIRQSIGKSGNHLKMRFWYGKLPAFYIFFSLFLFLSSVSHSHYTRTEARRFIRKTIWNFAPCIWDSGTLVNLNPETTFSSFSTRSVIITTEWEERLARNSKLLSLYYYGLSDENLILERTAVHKIYYDFHGNNTRALIWSTAQLQSGTFWKIRVKASTVRTKRGGLRSGNHQVLPERPLNNGATVGKLGSSLRKNVYTVDSA